MRVERLVQVYLIVERRGGAVYRTRHVRDEWVTTDAVPPEGHQFVPMSTSYTGETMRYRRSQ